MKKNAKADEIPGGLAEGKDPDEFPKEQLRIGTKVEMEHTDDRDVAQEIAMDHLTEDKKYYEKLALMEKGAKMPKGVVKTKADEKLWERAKAIASKQDAKEPYALTMHIFQQMKTAKKKDAAKCLDKAEKREEHKTPPKEYREGGAKQQSDYAAPGFKYPIDTEEHVRAAISYFSKPKNAAVYSQSEQASIWGRIKAAAKKFKIQLGAESGPPSVEAKKCMKKSDIFEEILSRDLVGELLGDDEESPPMVEHPRPGEDDLDAWFTGNKVEKAVPMVENTRPGEQSEPTLGEEPVSGGEMAMPPMEAKVANDMPAAEEAKEEKLSEDAKPVEQELSSAPFALEEESPGEGGKPDLGEEEKMLTQPEPKEGGLSKPPMVEPVRKSDWIAGLVHNSEAEDERIMKCLDEHGNVMGEPTLDWRLPLVQRRVCKMCKSSVPAFLTTCPGCSGEDGKIAEENLALLKSLPSRLRAPRQAPDVRFAGGVIELDEEQ